MVQYKLRILPDNSYERHSRQPYWEITEGIYVPPQWKDVPSCILDEWLLLMPEQNQLVVIGGTEYSLQDDLLLPFGQQSCFILTEDDVRTQQNRRHQSERSNAEALRFARYRRNRPRRLEFNIRP